MSVDDPYAGGAQRMRQGRRWSFDAASRRGARSSSWRADRRRLLLVGVGVARDDDAVTIDREAAYAAVGSLATWSEWKPFAAARADRSCRPGVYQMRSRDDSNVYVAMAGERKGQAIRGRLSIYRRGKGAASGFSEAALDRRTRRRAVH